MAPKSKRRKGAPLTPRQQKELDEFRTLGRPGSVKRMTMDLAGQLTGGLIGTPEKKRRKKRK
jgi:hypothetical protein